MMRSVGLWFAATRPAFLSVTAVGVLLGLACAIHDHAFRSGTLAVVTLLFAMVAHAGANVINDYYDARSGCDAANTDRISPFTGGSRFIQNGFLTEHQTKIFGYGLLIAVVPAGLWLLSQSGSALVWIGLMGLFSGWSYSATPLKLQSRGFGEITIIVAWLMVVIGSNYVQSRSLNPTALYAGLAYAPLIANVLFINQIPDRKADGSVGKNTLIVRWGVHHALWGCLALYSLSAIALCLGVAFNKLPIGSLAALVSAAPTSLALLSLSKNPRNPDRLKVAILATIGASLSFGTILSITLMI